MANHWNNVVMTAEQYVREYLDPGATLDVTPMTESEAAECWAEMERTFAADGGTGMSRLAFVSAVGTMQQRAGFGGW